MSKHTKGPWKVFEKNDGNIKKVQVSFTNFTPIILHSTSVLLDGEWKLLTQKEEVEANGSLICAAPDMYNLLVKVKEACIKYNVEALVPEYEQICDLLDSLDNPSS